MRRQRSAKIVATLGPASNSAEKHRGAVSRRRRSSSVSISATARRTIIARVYDRIRALEKGVGRPIGIMADLQGPKLRVGTFADRQGDARIRQALPPRSRSRRPATRRARRCRIPRFSPRIEPGHASCCSTTAICASTVEQLRQGFRRDHGRRSAATLSDRKGVNVPERGAAARRADAEGSHRSRLRARSRRRLDRAVLRAAARGRRRGAQAGRRPRQRAGEAREAGGDQAGSTRSSSWPTR